MHGGASQVTIYCRANTLQTLKIGGVEKLTLKIIGGFYHLMSNLRWTSNYKLFNLLLPIGNFNLTVQEALSFI